MIYRQHHVPSFSMSFFFTPSFYLSFSWILVTDSDPKPSRCSGSSFHRPGAAFGSLGRWTSDARRWTDHPGDPVRHRDLEHRTTEEQCPGHGGMVVAWWHGTGKEHEFTRTFQQVFKWRFLLTLTAGDLLEGPGGRGLRYA